MADDNSWEFIGRNDAGWKLIDRFAQVMRLSRVNPRPQNRCHGTECYRIFVEALPSEILWPDLPRARNGAIRCRVGPFRTPAKLSLQLARLAHVVANGSEEKGGLLVHGALAEWNGKGVILAGPGGVGKTTATTRIPRHWRPLSDDASLIVKTPDGEYWAHPWPTWSRIRMGDKKTSWDVQTAVKLHAIFMLVQGKKDFVSRQKSVRSISELVDVSGQTYFIMANGLKKASLRRINVLRFNNSLNIVKKIPICRLEISQKGKFWKEINTFLAGNSYSY